MVVNRGIPWYRVVFVEGVLFVCCLFEENAISYWLILREPQRIRVLCFLTLASAF